MTKTYHDWSTDRAYLLPPSPHDWLPRATRLFLLDTVGSLDIRAIFAEVDPIANPDRLQTRSFRSGGVRIGSGDERFDQEPSRRYSMVRVEMTKWGQTLEDLRLASVSASHRRSRERFQALYLIASGRFNATTCAAHIGRQDETVLDWIHRYNAQGPDALTYRRTGGRAPLLTSAKRNRSPRSSRRAAPPRTACPVTAGP
jgi:hypothetical protein